MGWGALCELCNKIIEQEELSKMNETNLAIVWVPNLLDLQNLRQEVLALEVSAANNVECRIRIECD